LTLPLRSLSRELDLDSPAMRRAAYAKDKAAALKA
jgi:hypothetical protein